LRPERLHLIVCRIRCPASGLRHGHHEHQIGAHSAGLSEGSAPDRSNVPRFWASIWIDVLKASLEATTKQRHLSALARLYDAAERQLGSNCLDRLLADLDSDALEDVLVGFLAQLRNEAAINGADRSSNWHAALSFVTDILRHGSSAAGSRAATIEIRLLRLDRLYGVFRRGRPIDTLAQKPDSIAIWIASLEGSSGASRKPRFFSGSSTIQREQRLRGPLCTRCTGIQNWMSGRSVRVWTAHAPSTPVLLLEENSGRLNPILNDFTGALI
jgi:hypothetical protein